MTKLHFCKIRGILFAISMVLALASTIGYFTYHFFKASNVTEPTIEGFLAVSDKNDVGKPSYPQIDWPYWRSVNNNIIGWITIEGTRINHPIVQARENDPTFYLHHNVFDKSDEKGCAFLDAECESCGLLSKNSVIFGHNLIDGRGFAAFADYSNEGFAKSHQKIMLQTPDWQKTLKVMFVEITQGNAKTKLTSFENEERFAAWLHRRYENSCIKLDNSIEQGIVPSRIWTFCTCSYNIYEDERTLVYATEE